MTDFASLLVADRGQPARDIHLVDKERFEAWLKEQPERIRAAVEAQRFQAKGYELAILPGDSADAWSVALGVAKVDSAVTCPESFGPLVT